MPRKERKLLSSTSSPACRKQLRGSPRRTNCGRGCALPKADDDSVAQRLLTPANFTTGKEPRYYQRLAIAEVDALKHLQGENTAELDALLSALLDRAFKGEL